jgi:hypothetical protein
VRDYLDRQFPPSQVVSVCVVVTLSYLLYGRMADTTPVGYEPFGAAAVVVVLFLQIRLVEDLEIDYSGGELIGEIGRRRRPPRADRSTRVVVADGRVVPTASTLVAATALTTVVACALSAPMGAAVVAAALATTAVLLLSGLLLRIRRLPRIFGTVLFFELVPALAIAYVYFAWRAASGDDLAVRDVVSVAGLFWTNWQFWKLSRGIGKYDVERVYGLAPRATCAALLGVVALALALQVALHSAADLSLAYLVYAIALSAVFAVAIARTVRELGRPEGLDGQPRWVGLPFAHAVIAGIVAQLVAFAF